MDLFLWVRYLLEYGQDNIVVISCNGAFYREHPNTKTKLLTDDFENETLFVFHFIIVLISEKNTTRISNHKQFSTFVLGLKKQEIRSIKAKIKNRHLFLLKKNLRLGKYHLMFKYIKEYINTLY